MGVRMTKGAILYNRSMTAAAQSPRSQRLALIGNGAYRDAPLPNPKNDAADMARVLEARGFTVIRRENATYDVK